VMWTRAYNHYPFRDYWCPACGKKLCEGREGCGAVDHECKNCKVNYGVLDG